MQDLIYVIDEDSAHRADLAYVIDSGNEAEWVDDVAYPDRVTGWDVGRPGWQSAAPCFQTAGNK